MNTKGVINEQVRSDSMGLFSREPKSFCDMSDRELIKYIEKPPLGASIAERAHAIEEAISRGLTNPRTGKPYHY